MSADEPRHIVAMGGGGFLMEPNNPLLDDHVLRLTGRAKPRVCFVGTASGDAHSFIERFHAAFDGRAECSHLSLFREYPEDLRGFVLNQDVLYVGGGNTANLLAVWRVHGLDRIIREAWEAGTILAGISAGMICWFQSSVTDSFGGRLAPLHDGLGLLPGSACPHYDGEPHRRPTYRQLVAEGALPPGYAADDGAALHFRGTRLFEAVTSRPHAGAYRIEASSEENGTIETPLPTRYLGSSGHESVRT